MDKAKQIAINARKSELRGILLRGASSNADITAARKEIPNPARKDSVESERQILSLLKSVGLTPDSKDRVRPAKNAVEEVDEAEEFLRQGDVIRFQRQE